MTKRMLIDALHPEEVRVVIADQNQIFDFDFVTSAKKQVKGNIYLAKITRVEPSLQAAFVEYGAGKQGFLPFSEIHTDYYQIPVADRKRLMEEAMREEAEDDISPAASMDAEVPLASDSAGETTATALASTDTSYDTQTETALPPLPEILPVPDEAMDNEDDRQPVSYAASSSYVPAVSEPVEETESSLFPLSPYSDTADGMGESATPDNSVAFPQSVPDVAAPDATEATISEGVETLAGEDEEMQARPKKNTFTKRYKIQEVIRRGQIVLVQVIKEERGNKGASLTTYLSLAGRYCVLMPNSPKDGGISRKIAGGEDRKRLKAISTELRLAQGMSVIIRTAGMDRTRTEIKRDFDYLVKLWNQIRETTLQSNAPALIYEESDIIKRAIRDQYTSDIDEIVVEGQSAFENARDFMKMLLPSQTPKVKSYSDPTPLFYAYNVEDQLLSMHDPVVKLRSGGYLVINPTEALISIDVNSGRATGERNIEETATKTNLEAAAEVARQLRLRDLAGLIVIDFIDMMESRNRRAVEKALKDSLKSDRAKIQLGRISPFGLLEMSRQRIRPSISESNMVQCEHCSGRGFVRSNESMSIQIVRALEKEACTGTWSSLRLIASQAVALHLLNHKRDLLRSIEQRHNITLQVLIDAELSSSEYNLEKMRRPQGERNENERRRDRGNRSDRHKPALAPVQQTANIDDAPDDMIEIETEEDAPDTMRPEGADGQGRKRQRRRRGGRNRNRNREGRPDLALVETSANTEESDLETATADNENDASPELHGEAPETRGSRPPRQRGGRNRRRWRDRDEQRASASGSPVLQDEPSAEYASAQNAPYAQSMAERIHDVIEPNDGQTLPAFATEERPLIELAANRPAPEPVVSTPVVEDSSSGSNQPSKKGWWQKMIELDE